MSTDNVEWLTSGLLTPHVMRERTTPIRIKHVSQTQRDALELPAGRIVCDNRVNIVRTDTGEALGQVPGTYRARTPRTPEQARQRKNARRASRASRRANR